MKTPYAPESLILAGSLLLQASVLCFHATAAPGDVDLSFDPGSPITNAVAAIAVQSDGKVLVGGPLTFINGTNRYASVRLNTDGSRDTAFVSDSFIPDWTHLFQNGFFNDAEAVAVAVQSDGKVLVGGMVARNCPEEECQNTFSSFVTRLNADGSHDTSFTPFIGDLGLAVEQIPQVRTLAVQPNGEVVVGYVGYGLVRGIVRLNANGIRDTNFNTSIGAGLGVDSIVPQPDGKLLIGGPFNTVNGTDRNALARLNADGALDATFIPAAGVGGSPLALQPDGKVIVRGFARLNADGSLDSSFNAGTGANGAVASMSLQSNGQVLIAGAFTSVNGTNCNRVARLNADGSLDSSFRVIRGVESPVSALVLQADGQVLIGGAFTFLNGTNRYGRDRLNAAGRVDGTLVSSSFNPDLSFVIQAGDCWAGPPDFECSQSSTATTVLVQPDGKVLVGGYTATIVLDLFDNHPFISHRCFLARVHADGSRDTSFQPLIGQTRDVPEVTAFAVQPNGKVVVGRTYSGIARLHTDGSPDTSFNSGIDNPWVSAVALQADGKVLLAGGFSTLRGTNVSYGIARLDADGTLDNSFDPGGGTFGITSLAVQPDGKVVIGGDFFAVNGTARNRIARLNADGSLDLSFHPGTGANGMVRCVALQADGNVLIAGDFTTVNSVVRPYVARLYGDSAPTLSIARSNALMTISWPVNGLSFQLQESTNLAQPNAWLPVVQLPVTNGAQISVTIPASAERKFFRLKSE
ncbi:MAG: hypothetical protein KIS67_24230 [Verrucomicrobiae bacterium]|nr:hypothetical protein [Verrucomicrobiae bacterium]